MEEEKSGITLKDVFRIIFSQKWLALLVAIVVAVICVFVVYFGYGPSKAEYFSSFTISMATDENSNTVYPDGREFNYRQIVSRENLEAVKNSNKSFANIDLNNLNIAISQNAPVEGETSVVYTMSVKASAFASKSVAANFVSAVVGTTENEVKDYIAQYGADIAANYASKSGYELKLEYLDGALETIELKLTQMNSDFTAEIVKIENLHYEISLLKSELYTAAYESDVKALQNSVYYLKDLQLELKQVEEALANLISMGVDGAAGTTIVINGADKIATYSERKIALTETIKYYETILSDYESGGVYTIPETVEKKDGEEAFAEKLDNLQASVRSLAENAFNSEYLEKSSVVVFVGDVVTKVGETGLLTSLVIGVVAGIVVAAVVAYIVGWNKLKKPNKDKTVLQSSEEPVEGGNADVRVNENVEDECVAQAAICSDEKNGGKNK